MTEEKEELAREIRELKDARDCFLEETAALNRRNEELAQLNAEYERRLDSSNAGHSKAKSITPPQPKQSMDSWRSRPSPAPPIVNAASTASTASTATLFDESSDESRTQKSRTDVHDTPQPKGRGIQLRWPMNKVKELPTMQGQMNGGKKRLEHTFQQMSMLKLGKCDHCGDKLWGTAQVRCSGMSSSSLFLLNCNKHIPFSGCPVAVHARCVASVQSSCTQVETPEDSSVQPVLLR